MALLEALRGRLYQYYLLMRFDRPIGIYLVMWPALWGLWTAAKGRPSLRILAVFVLGAILMRAAGCVINDFADRKIDGQVERTRKRPMATGQVSSVEALLLFALLCLTAFGLVLTQNALTVKLALVAVALATLYPFTKRFTHLPQLFLGAAFAMAVPMAFAAVLGEIPNKAWVLFAATVLWAMVYDTEYALVDRDDDRRIGVKSTAVLFGRWDRVWIGAFQVLVIALLVIAGRQAKHHWLYFVAVAWGAGLFVYQQRLLARRDRDSYFRAFLNNAWFGALIFAGLSMGLLVSA